MASGHAPQSHRALLLIFATSLSPPKSAFLLTQFPFAESDVAPIPSRTPPAYHRNHLPYKELPHGPFQHLVSSHSSPFEALHEDNMKTILPNFVPVYQPIAVGHKGVKN